MVRRTWILSSLILSSLCFVVYLSSFLRRNVAKSLLESEVYDKNMLHPATDLNPQACGRLCQIRKLIKGTRTSFDAKAKATLQSLHVWSLCFIKLHIVGNNLNLFMYLAVKLWMSQQSLYSKKISPLQSGVRTTSAHFR
jgi:hypothetical protein